MRFSPPLMQGTLLKRYKRFLADIETPGGETLTIHCPNTGSMKHCVVPGSPCWYSLSDNPKRKLPGTLEITTTTAGHRAGVNTALPNRLVREAIEQGVITELSGYDSLRAEVRYGHENSRIDLLLEDADRGQCYVEIKNVTLEAGDGLIIFPDAVTNRGTKHLRELIGVVEAGHRAVLLFCVQHSGATAAGPADDIDPLYGQTLREALDRGVEVLAYGCDLGPDEITIARRLAFWLP